MFEQYPTDSAQNTDKPSSSSRRAFLKNVARGAAALGAASVMPGCSATETAESSPENLPQHLRAQELLQQFESKDMEETMTYQYLKHRFSREQFVKDMHDYHHSAEFVTRAWDRAIARHKERWLESAQREKYYRILAKKNGIDLTDRFEVGEIQGKITINGIPVQKEISPEKKAFFEQLNHTRDVTASPQAKQPLEGGVSDTSAY